MMRILKTLMVAVAVTALLLTVIPLTPVDAAPEGTSVAYDGTTYHYVRYSVPQYYSVMTGFDAGTDTFMRLQSRLEGYEVTQISDGVLADSPNVTVFVIPEGIKTIGASEFKNCGKLQTIIFLGEMPEFDDNTFSGVKAGVQVQYLSVHSDSWSKFSALPKSELKVYEYRGSNCSFSYYEMDGSVTIYKQKSGQKIEIPSSLDVGGRNVPVKHIGASAFEYDETSTQDKITSVTISEGIEFIDIAAFKYCEFMETLSLPSTLKVIYDEAFRMPIDSTNWNRSALKAVTLPDTLEYIGFEAFRMCYNLKTVVVPDSVTYYGDGAFRVCSSMESISLGEGIRSLGESSFDHCHALVSIKFPSKLESIGGQCFAQNRSLKYVTIPDSVKTIGGGAFNGCSSLSEIALSDDAVIGNNCFGSSSPMTVRITSSSNSGQGIVKQYITGNDWQLPGADGRLSLLIIDTQDALNVDIKGDSATFIRFTERGVNTTGGTYIDNGKLLLGPDRAGKTFGATNDRWYTKDVATIVVSSSDSTLGTVTHGGTYEMGTEITLNATAKRYVLFKGWSDGVTDTSRKITVSTDLDLTGFFEAAPTSTLTITINPAGSGNYTGAGKYVTGDTAKISATPKSGYHFIGWSDGSTDESREIIVDKDIQLVASFGNLTVSFDTNGGKVAVPPMYSNEGWEITLPGSNEILDGKSITKWLIDGVEYKVGASYTVHDSVTATAIWEGGAPSGTDNTWMIIVAVIAIILIAIIALIIVKRNSNKTR